MPLVTGPFFMVHEPTGQFWRMDHAVADDDGEPTLPEETRPITAEEYDRHESGRVARGEELAAADLKIESDALVSRFERTRDRWVKLGLDEPDAVAAAVDQVGFDPRPKDRKKEGRR